MNSSPFTRSDLKFFKLDRITDGVFQLYISVTVLLFLKVNEKTIKNGVLKNKKGKSRRWIALPSCGTLWIRYDSIPQNTLSARNLPSDDRAMYEKLQCINSFQEEYYADAQFLEIYNSLEHAYSDWFPTYVPGLKKFFRRENVLIRYAKNCALINQAIKLKDQNFPPDSIFTCYKKLAVKEMSNCNSLIFTTESSISFWRKVKQAESEGIINALVHKAIGVKREDRRRGSEAIDALIRVLLRKPERLTLPKILKRVNTKFNANLSLSYVKKIACKLETKNLTDFDANGYFYSRANSLPKLKRELAKKPGELFQADYYTQQFIVRKPDGNIGTMLSYFVIDVYSRKIVGWSTGPEMDEHIALSAFKRAFISCGFLPEAISVDNDWFYKRPDFVSFVESLKSLGVVWLQGDPYKPTVRAEIESFFSVYQKVYCSDKKFYLGEDVKSKNHRGVPNEELVKRYWQSKNQLPNSDDLNDEIRRIVKAYNYHENETEHPAIVEI